MYKEEQRMTITEALARCHALLQECSIPIKDSGKASEALRLLEASIKTLRAVTENGEESA